VQSDAPNPILDAIHSGTHFIPRIGIQMHFAENGSHVLQFDLGDRVADTGLVGLLADMAGGQVIIAARQPCESATTHIEVRDVGNLVGPGEIVARSRLLATSKRRGVIETLFELGEGRALAHTTFSVRDGSLRPAVMPAPPRAQPSTEPLWQFIGVRQTAAGSAIAIGPLVGNHTGALHGGAVIALAEAAAVQQLQPGEAFEGVSVHYLHAVKGTTANAVARRHGRSVIVDLHSDGSSQELARLTFTIT